MRESLNLHAEATSDFGKLGDLFERKLARKRHALGSKTRSRLDSGSIVDIHLGRYMQSSTGNNLGESFGDADILNDERIGAGSIGFARKGKGAVDLRGEDLDVEGYVHVHAAQMGVIARRAQILDSEIVGIAASIEFAEAKVDRIGARPHRCTEAFVVARWGKDLDMLFHSCVFLI